MFSEFENWCRQTKSRLLKTAPQQKKQSTNRKPGEHIDKNHIGAWAESIALEYLQAKSLKLRERNFRCKLGEIDLIMESSNKTIVFVEVRYRKRSGFGSALETVGPQKQRKLIKTAEYYLQQHKLSNNVSCRFDVMAIESKTFKSIGKEPDNKKGNALSDNFNIEWVENAF